MYHQTTEKNQSFFLHQWFADLFLPVFTRHFDIMLQTGNFQLNLVIYNLMW